jgi:hypothetical protein
MAMSIRSVVASGERFPKLFAEHLKAAFLGLNWSYVQAETEGADFNLDPEIPKERYKDAYNTLVIARRILQLDHDEFGTAMKQLGDETVRAIRCDMETDVEYFRNVLAVMRRSLFLLKNNEARTLPSTLR